MYRFIVLLMLLGTMATSPLGADEFVDQPRALDIQAIIDTTPEAYASFEISFQATYGVDDAEVAVGLMREVRVAAEQLQDISRSEQAILADAYRTSWRICLQTWKNSANIEARQMILNEWDRALAGDVRFVPFQICALPDDWDRVFLTEAFWRNLEQIRATETVAAICYAVYEAGDERDFARLAERRESIRNLEIARILQNTLNWIGHRENPVEPGPAAFPPQIIRDPASVDFVLVEDMEYSETEISHAERLRRECEERKNSR